MRLVKKDRLSASSCGADVNLSVEGAFRIVEYTVTSYISSFSKIRLYIDTVLQKADGSKVVSCIKTR